MEKKPPGGLRATRHSRDLRVHLEAARADLEDALGKTAQDGSSEVSRRIEAAIAAVKRAQEALEDQERSEASGGP